MISAVCMPCDFIPVPFIMHISDIIFNCMLHFFFQPTVLIGHGLLESKLLKQTKNL